MAAKIAISDSVSKAWELTKKNIGFLAGVVLLSWALPTILQKLLGEGVLVSLISAVISMIISIGLIKIAIKVADGKKPELSDIYDSYPLFFNYLFASILLGLIFMVGFIFFIIPGIYLALKYQFAFYLIIDKKMGVMEAIQKSGQMTEGKIMDLFALMLVALVINFLGALAFGLGLLVSAPLTMVTYALVYKKLLK